jgi:energy-coupling factor transporter ATP-binding protein EcfA2
LDEGKNLLIFGENGSGKSSLFLGLKSFLESGIKNLKFENYQNIFIPDDAGYVKLSIGDSSSTESTYTWSRTTVETNNPLIMEIAKVKGFIDYKSLLETSFTHYKNDRVNIFELLVNNLLSEITNDVSNQTFSKDYSEILAKIPKRKVPKEITPLETLIKNFNTGLSNKLNELKKNTPNILQNFGYTLDLDFEFLGIRYDKKTNEIQGKEIILKVKFFGKEINTHHHFLNEARLSAIAISLYFSSLLLHPKGKLNILVLDDVLIGLDISNRIPILDIIDKDFSDYQIILMTYDKIWYEIIHQRMKGKNWKNIEFFCSSTGQCDIPMYVERKEYLDKAEKFLNETHDDKAAIIYARSAFETIIKKFCEKHGLKIRYKENQKKLKSEDFWTAITEYNTTKTFLDVSIIRNIEVCRSIVLNPLSHASIQNIPKKEIGDTINLIRQLETVLTQLSPD